MDLLDERVRVLRDEVEKKPLRVVVVLLIQCRTWRPVSAMAHACAFRMRSLFGALTSTRYGTMAIMSVARSFDVLTGEAKILRRFESLLKRTAAAGHLLAWQATSISRRGSKSFM